MTIIKISAIALVVALAAAPSVVQAASETCSVAWSDHFCRTAPVPANPQFNFVHVNVTGPCDLFSVTDVNNGVLVFAASSGWGGFERTLGHVYSEYTVSVFSGVWPITSVTINN